MPHFYAVRWRPRLVSACEIKLRARATTRRWSYDNALRYEVYIITYHSAYFTTMSLETEHLCVLVGIPKPNPNPPDGTSVVFQIYLLSLLSQAGSRGVMWARQTPGCLLFRGPCEGSRRLLRPTLHRKKAKVWYIHNFYFARLRKRCTDVTPRAKRASRLAAPLHVTTDS